MPDKEDGFVLAEILVAMVVLSIAAIAFLQILQERTAGLSMVRVGQTQSELALSLMNTALETADAKSETGIDEASRLNWSILIVPDADRQARGAEQPSINKVRVEVWSIGTDKTVLESAKWDRRS